MSVQSVLDSIDSAQKYNIIPDQEFILQGKSYRLIMHIMNMVSHNVIY